MKLLTEEQRTETLQQKMKEITESSLHFTSREIDWMRDNALLEAQAHLTLQEVGEWLEREGLELTWDNSQGFEDVLKWEGTEGRLVFVSKAMIEALKRGEMPE